MYSVPPHSISRPPTSLLEARIASTTSVQRNGIGGEAVGIDRDLILLLIAADGGYLGDPRHRLQRVAQRPVLIRAQLVERVPARRVHQRVLEDPAHPGGVGAQFRLHPLGKSRLDLGQVLEHPRARPVEIGAVLEDHVHVGEAEVGEAADGLHLGRAEKRGDDRVGDLVLDDVRRAVPSRVDDDLRVGQVGKRIEADPLQRDGGEHAQRGHHEQDEQPVVGRERDDAADHCPAPDIALLKPRLGIEEEVGAHRDLLALGDAGQHLNLPVGAHPERDLTRLEHALAGLHEHDLPHAGVEHRVLGDEHALGGLDPQTRRWRTSPA